MSSAIMAEPLAVLSSADDLVSEVARLRGEIERLQGMVQRLDQLAHLDALVELPNRRGFMRQLEGAIGRVQRYGESAALLFVDLDGLKLINDSHGHKAGDQALIRVAQMLVSGVRTGDCVARLGGDEFGILLDHSDESIAMETAARLVDRIGRCEFSLDGSRLPLSVAIGVGMIGPDDNAECVLERADEAMYQQKVALA
ncbi:MAG: GGDEF domain-containing protein [Sphingomonas sp.]|nr:GGDEF domain-containing protein [Sphingomonas sp.]